jgi:Tol biopolymer transport system component
MLPARILALAALLAAYVFAPPLAAQVVLRDLPDEWISQPVAGTDLGAVYPSISDDGRYVAFQAEHPQLSFADVVYVADRQAGGALSRVGLDCFFADQCELERPHISGNGRFVVFDSTDAFTTDPLSAELTQPDRDVFVWDRQTGSTSRVTLAPGGAEPDGESFAGDISRDGRYVVFTSRATNLHTVGPSLLGAPVRDRTYWADRQNGTVKLVYEGTATDARNDAYPTSRMSSNGRYVLASRTGAAKAINWDALNGTVGYPVDDYWHGPESVAITSDRRYVAGNAFPDQSWVIRVDPSTGGTIEYFSTVGPITSGLDLSAGAGWLATNACHNAAPPFRQRLEFYGRNGRVAHVSLHGGTDCHFHAGIDMTPDGRYAVVSSLDIARPGVDPFDADNDGLHDVFLVVNPQWQPGPANIVAAFTSVPANSRNVKVSVDGRIGVFESEIPASEFGPYTDANGSADVFRFLADFQQIELLSTSDGTAAFPGGASNPAMSQDGEVVLFEAPDNGIAAVDLVPSGKSERKVTHQAAFTSVFARRLVQGTLQRLSSARAGGAPDGASQNATVSSDGRYAAFATDATNVNPGADPNAVRDVVALDLQSGARYCVSTCGAVVADAPSDHPSISANGQVAFESGASTVQKAAGLAKGGGQRQVVLRDLVSGTSQVLSRTAGGLAGDGPSTRPSVSRDASVVAYQSAATNLDAAGSDGVVNVIRHVIGRGNQRVSRRPGPGKGALPADGDSERPVVSGDGRFIAFQTAAGNLVDGDTNGASDLLVHDARGASLQRLGAAFGGGETNGDSAVPHLNHNGTRVGFHSFASNLDAESEGSSAAATSAPYTSDNPAAAAVVFGDTFQ